MESDLQSGQTNTAPDEPGRLFTERPLRIGYFTGSFPASTHTFFWREVQGLRALGVEVDLISTRLPRNPSLDDWGQAALSETTYLWPFRWPHVRLMFGSFLRTAPSGWLRLFAAWLRSDGQLEVQIESTVGITFCGVPVGHCAGREAGGMFM